MDAETRYLEMEKLAFALMVVSRKVRLYFHAYPIEVLTNYPLRQVLQKPKASGRLPKWAIKLGQFDVNFLSRTTIKGQALANFIANFIYFDATKVTGIANSAKATKVAIAREIEDFVSIKVNTGQWTL